VSALAGGGVLLVLAAFVAAHAVGRGGLAAVMAISPTARLDGLAASAGRPTGEGMAASLAIAALVALVALGFRAGLGAMALACVAMATITIVARRQVGGYTGDVLGAIEQGGETAMLLAAAAWV